MCERLGVSTAALEDVVASLRRNVRRFLWCGRSGRKDVPVAVVVNKADVPVVSERLGPRTAKRALGDGNRPYREIPQETARDALEYWGAGSELAALESSFSRIAYFSCSSLGRTPDTSRRPFVAEGVVAPLLWLLGQPIRGGT